MARIPEGFHPLAELFPMMADDDLGIMVDDIKERGLQSKIVVFEGKILDGRNRFKACQIAKVKPTFADFEGDDPLAFVLSANLHRRHLTTSQRAMIAAKIASGAHGGPRKIGNDHQGANLPLAQTQADAAEKLNVSERIVKQAKKVHTNGTPKQIADVEAGNKTVNEVVEEIEEKAAPKEHPGDAYCVRVNKITHQIDAIMRECDELKTDDLGHEIHWPTALDYLKQVRQKLHINRPRRTCPYCAGKGKRNGGACKSCLSTGRVGEVTYRSGCKAMGVPVVEGGDE